MSATTNPLGVHARTLSRDWTREGAELAVRRTLNAGFDFLEIPAPVVGELDAVATRRLLEFNDLDATVSLALTPEQDINSTDEASSRRGEEALISAVRFAAAIGATYVGGVTFSQLGRYRSLPTAPARRNALAVLGRVARLAAEDGVTVGVEYVNRYESNLLNTAEQTVAFLDELDEPNAVLHLDTFHANSEDPSVAAAVETAGHRLAYIHASESHRGALGSGSLDWNGFFEALQRIGYRGPITFESFSPTVVSPEMTVEVGLWRAPWTSADAVATDARTFLSLHLAALRGLATTSIGTP
ncbi:sugar phosphate isomerase/epimerase family protein [Amnibacterium endophyticum]|uniref:Sugar phosphate isomerase/epimerase family protein n=1 Tax=Amnibacterium endophyticum TaxID=2109337 RepID=A0ABW4LF08_9MICO